MGQPLNDDILQNELILINHHLDDIEKGLAENDINYIKRGLIDIRESINRLSKFITPQQSSELNRMSESFEARLNKVIKDIY